MRALSKPGALTRVVTIHRDREDGESVPDRVFELHALRPGVIQWVLAAYPEPTHFINGEEKPNPAALPTYALRSSMILIARSMPEEFDTPSPATSADRKAWDAYGAALVEEAAEAGLVQGDLDRLFREFQRLNHGAGTLGKQSS